MDDFFEQKGRKLTRKYCIDWLKIKGNLMKVLQTFLTKKVKQYGKKKRYCNWKQLNRVIIDDKLTEWLVTDGRVQQGSVLSAILFDVIMNNIIKKFKKYEPNEDTKSIAQMMCCFGRKQRITQNSKFKKMKGSDTKCWYEDELEQEESYENKLLLFFILFIKYANKILTQTSQQYKKFT